MAKHKFTDYYLVVNLDERGEYSASVYDPNDKSVFEIESVEQVNELQTDGFLKYAPDEDLDRLTKYLMGLELIPNGSQVWSEDKFPHEDYAKGGKVKKEKKEQEVYRVKWQQHDEDGNPSRKNEEDIEADSPKEAWTEAYRQGDHASDYLISIDGVPADELKFGKREQADWKGQKSSGGSMEKGGEAGEEEEVDLFEDYENQPKEVAKIVDKYFTGDDCDYDTCAKALAEMEAIGYTFEYGLDAEPYGLRKIKISSGGSMSKGGAVNLKDKMKKIFNHFASDGALIFGGSYFNSSSSIIHEKGGKAGGRGYYIYVTPISRSFKPHIWKEGGWFATKESAEFQAKQMRKMKDLYKKVEVKPSTEKIYRELSEETHGKQADVMIKENSEPDEEENKTEEDYEEYLNEMGEVYDYESDQWIIGGKHRWDEFNGQYGSALKKHDPIAFQVGFREWNP